MPSNLSSTCCSLRKLTEYTELKAANTPQYEKLLAVLRVEAIKMHLIPIHRSFGAFLVLLFSAILLSTWNHGTTTHLAKRQPLAENTDPSPLDASSATIAAKLLGVHDDQFNLSDTHLSHVINKRARTLTFNTAVCTGRKLYYQVIQDALDGSRAPGKEYGEDGIKNGWTREPLTRLIPIGFEEAFKAIGKNVFPDIGERIPTFEETSGVNLIQDKAFINSAGKKQDVSELSLHNCSRLWHRQSLTSYPLYTGNPAQG